MNRTLEFIVSELKEESREQPCLTSAGNIHSKTLEVFVVVALVALYMSMKDAKTACILKFYWVGTVANKESTIMNIGCVCLCGGDLVTKWCLILCDIRDCTLPGSSVHGISQARILEWVDISFFRGSSPWLQHCNQITDWSASEALLSYFYCILILTYSTWTPPLIVLNGQLLPWKISKIRAGKSSQQETQPYKYTQRWQ